MADRKAELEKKRKKLDELRKARDQTKKDTSFKESLSKSPAPDSLEKKREDVNKLVTDLIGGSLGKPATSTRSPSKSPEPQPPGGEEKATPISVSTRKKPVKLVVDTLAPVNINPRAVEVYAKQTQTDVVVAERLSDQEDDTESPAEPVRQDRHDVDRPSQGPDDQEKPFLRSNVELSGEQVDRIVASDDFGTFMDRASRLVERALCDTSDILFDYLRGDSEERGDGLASLKVVKKKEFFDQRWSQSRGVNAIDWSSHHSELLLVSYHTNPNIPHDPDGVALMWDLRFQKDTPDYVFNSQSAVVSVAFSKFHPSYVIGGTYSGQIVLWDMRGGKRTPVQRSPLSSSAHTHPVYCLDVVGSQNAHNLISVSNDGKMCSWNLDMLSQPQESLELQNRQTRPVAVTSLSFPSNDVNKFLLGSEECLVYQGQRHGSKPGVAVQFEGHDGPITAVSSHRASGGQVDLSHLFVTSSFDWTMKLWSSKLQNEQQLTSKTGQPLCSFENNNEYVYDVQWSPVHPALFASVDGEGRLDLWNINEDTEVPILTESLDTALSKVCWSPTGHHLVTGDCEGRVSVFEAGEGLYTPHAEEWLKVQQTLLDLQNSHETSSSVL